MALVRVYCGVAAADTASWLTVALVDDASRLLDVRQLSDDPAGYAHLGALLADRSGGSAPVAVDSPGHLVTRLLAAANCPLALPDEAAVADFAERYSDGESYEEIRSTPGQRRAVGLARALQAGVLSAMAQSPVWDLEEFKPVLAAHAAVTAGRQAAAVALREVLRVLYPAALRAYPDPAEPIPLKILDVLPEPGLLTTSPSSRNRDASLVAELSASGVADTTTAVAAITALRVAVAESPRWHTNRLLAPIVAETVRQSVASVRACDAASAALIATLVERLGATTSGGMPPRPYLVPTIAPAPVTPVPRRPAGPAAEVPAGRLSRRVSAASAAAAGVPAAGGVLTDGYAADGYPAGAGPTVPAQRPAPGFAAPGSRSDWLLGPGAEDDMAGWNAAPPAASAYYGGIDDASATTLSFSLDPLNAPLPTPPGRASQQPWTADGLPIEPPALRLVDRPLPDPLAPPMLRVIDGEGAGRLRRPAGADPAAAPSGESDGDLLIFSQTPRSAWFTLPDDVSLTDDTASWGQLADEGWRAAEHVAQPAVGAETMAGLPRRVPQANLVPGSAPPPERQLRIVRDAESIAAHTTGYFRGWRRGQEIGGFAVGQRDRAAWEFNRDQRAREGADQRARLS